MEQGTAARRCQVFLGYRVASDIDLVEKLYLSLTAVGPVLALTREEELHVTGVRARMMEEAWD